MVFSPPLELGAGDSFFELVESLVDDVFRISSLVPRLAQRSPSPHYQVATGRCFHKLIPAAAITPSRSLRPTWSPWPSWPRCVTSSWSECRASWQPAASSAAPWSATGTSTWTTGRSSCVTFCSMVEVSAAKTWRLLQRKASRRARQLWRTSGSRWTGGFDSGDMFSSVTSG